MLCMSDALSIRTKPDGEGGGGEGGLRRSDVRNRQNYVHSFFVIFVENHICV